MTPKVWKSTFNIDDDFNESLPGYTAGQHWNGWACPYFEKEVAERILKAVSSFNKESWFKYISSKDAFVLFDAHDAEYGLDENGGTMTYTGMDVEVDGKIIHVYPIGAFEWIWTDDNEQ